MPPLYLPYTSSLSPLYLARSNLRQHQGSFAGGQDLEQKYLVRTLPVPVPLPLSRTRTRTYPYPYP